MSVYYQDDRVTLYGGDALDVLRGLPDASVDSVVTDPPYALGFMGKEWDKIGDTGRGARARVERAAEVTPTGQGHTTSGGAYLAAGVDSLRSAGRPFQDWCRLWATECLRVLKPGGHMLAFGGTRTWHRLACAIEDAGFEVRDSIAWLYGSGFPKSLDVSKAIDKAAGAEREVVGTIPDRWTQKGGTYNFSTDRAQTEVSVTGPAATPDAERWQGWGTALKPAFEPVVVARKPLAGTVAANVLEHGTGALNIDGCRVGVSDADRENVRGRKFVGKPQSSDIYAQDEWTKNNMGGIRDIAYHAAGRWPTNVVLDDSQAAELDEQSGERTSGSRKEGTYRGLGYMGSDDSDYPAIEGDTGGASRFFPTFRYEAKAPSSERPRVNGTAHPTVKPLDLMRWLVRLVTPPGGTVLEPFAGSGTTVEACIVEGFRCIAIEREADYLPLIEARMARRLDPVRAIELAGEDGGLFDLLGGEPA